MQPTSRQQLVHLMRAALCSAVIALTCVADVLYAPTSHAQPATSSGATKDTSNQTVRFALIGDTPYGEREERFARAVIEDISAGRGAQALDFMVHIGDLKGGDESCSDDLLEGRAAILRSSLIPLIYVPGDNEWTDCHRPSNGSFAPQERLERLRQLFFNQADSLGARSIKLTRQSDGARYKEFAEHQRWQQGAAVFVTLNVPGSNNNYQVAAGRNAEWQERSKAVQDWLRRSVEYARNHKAKVLVIAIHGDPIFNRLGGAVSTITGKPDGFGPFKQLLVQTAQEFGGQVVLLHGDTHMFKHDQPLKDAQGKTVKNFTRIESFGSPFMNQWVLVEISASGQLKVTPRKYERNPNGVM